MSRPDKIHPLVGGRVVVEVAQLVRALDCGSRGRGFESRLSPFPKPAIDNKVGRGLNSEKEASQKDLFFFLSAEKANS